MMVHASGEAATACGRRLGVTGAAGDDGQPARVVVAGEVKQLDQLGRG